MEQLLGRKDSRGGSPFPSPSHSQIPLGKTRATLSQKRVLLAQSHPKAKSNPSTVLGSYVIPGLTQIINPAPPYRQPHCKLHSKESEPSPAASMPLSLHRRLSCPDPLTDCLVLALAQLARPCNPPPQCTPLSLPHHIIPPIGSNSDLTSNPAHWYPATVYPCLTAPLWSTWVTCVLVCRHTDTLFPEVHTSPHICINIDTLQDKYTYFSVCTHS